jgi:2',3'-cyclic-nucleotide 2'-phosphodiesterase/3'-nucleotidase
MFQEAQMLWISAESIRDFLARHIRTHSPLQPIYSHNWHLIPNLAEIYFPQSLDRSQESLLVG